MDWNEITLKVPAKELETASAIAQMITAHGFYIEDYSDLLTEAPKIAHIDLIDEELLQKSTEESLIHLFFSPQDNLNAKLEFLNIRFLEAGIPLEISTTKVKEDDWANNWKQYYHPTRIGQNIIIRPSWEQYTPQSDKDVVITLDPGIAFGTGSHETTRLCLTMLEKYMQPGAAVLDVGTGSGILAVAAAKLGASSVLGIDIDAHAVLVADENSRLNGTAVTFRAGNLVDDVCGRYNLITANIVADIIIILLDDMARFLADGGTAVLSGIIDIREEDVLQKIAAEGFKAVETLRENGWTAIAIQKV